ncbi:alpha-tocopherol transfer protein-like protein [Caerostris darwini]|uniref:Alpha-tocopherol transfer protein-like protein n=1 Tax=Caerostris darwini TaxID=1538125 RepID=A0AAV4PVB0_9ARAC|nr:alpha-tocopherol transfer protein-like protein [Caerostris darwini]
MESEVTMMPSTKVIEKLNPAIHALRNGSDEPLSYFITYLTPAMIEEARTQLKETDESRTKGLEELKQLIKKESKLVTPTDESFLLAFLRARKFNAKKAFKLLQNYWRFRKEHKNIYDHSDSTSVKQLILKPMMGALTYRDKSGCVVLLFKVGMWDPDVDVYEQVFRAVTAVLVHSIQFPATQVCGYRIIFDLRGLTWTQLKMCTPSNMLLMIRSTQFCFPARYKGVHIISENKLFNLVWAVAHPLLTSKLKKRIMFHGTDLAPLSEYIDPSILPVEFGGQADPFENTKWSEVLDECTHQVLDQLMYGYKD